MRYLFLIAMLLIPNLAFAAEAVTQNWWQAALANLLSIVMAIATPAVILLGRKLVQVVAEKTGIEVAERHYMMVDELVNKGISYAHEQGRKALKADKPMDPDDKRAAAVTFVAESLASLGVVHAGEEQLTKLVEAKLNLRRDDPVKAGVTVAWNGERVISQ